MTTSLVALQFSNVCLIVLSRTRMAGEKIILVGLLPKILKKLNLERFTFPSRSIVLAKQIGLGEIAPSKYA